MPVVDSPVHAIPPTHAIRQRLVETVREGRILRRLLKVAEDRDKAQQQPKEAPCRPC